MTALILPEIGPGEQIDLRVSYCKQARWFFSLSIAAVVISLAKDLVLNGSFPALVNTCIQLVFVGIAVSAIVIKREWYHKLLALLTTVLFALYIVLLFTRLPSD